MCNSANIQYVRPANWSPVSEDKNSWYSFFNATTSLVGQLVGLRDPVGS